MADDRTTRQQTQPEAGRPPGGGRQSVGTHRAAQHWPLDGGGTAGVLAAGGGLNLPGTASEADRDAIGRARQLAGVVPSDLDTPGQEIVPGEYDPATAMIGSRTGVLGAGARDERPPSPAPAIGATDPSVDPRLAAERRREGGGGEV